MTIPAQHIVDAQKLVAADGIVELFEIWLKGGARVYIKNDDSVTYQGKVYEALAVKMSGVGNVATEETSRPQFSIVNPSGMFSGFVILGQLDMATVIRKRVLRTHLLANQPILTQQSWRVARVASMTREMITLELRDMLDGVNFITPVRQYLPPGFSQVSLR